MTDPATASPPTVETDHTLEINIPRQIVVSFSDEALATLNVEVQRYATRLTMAAKAQTTNEVVVKENVDVAAGNLRPAQTRDALKLFSDWSKRVAFLFIGFAVVVGSSVFTDVNNGKVPQADSLRVLLFNAVTASVLTAVAVTLDLFSVKRKNK